MFSISDLKLDYDLKVGGYQFLPNTTFKTVLNRIVTELGNSVSPTIPTSTLVGRFSAGTGSYESITLGAGLSLSGLGVLSASTALSGGAADKIAFWTSANTLSNNSGFQYSGGKMSIGYTGALSHTMHIRGASSLSGTNSLFVENSNATELFRLDNSGVLYLGGTVGFIINEFAGTIQLQGDNVAPDTAICLNTLWSGKLLFSNYTNSIQYGAITSTGRFGWGTTAPDRLMHVVAADAVTNAITYVNKYAHTTSGTATTNFGLGTEIELENASGINRIAATEEYIWSDATSASEDTSYSLKLMRAGTLTEAMGVTSVGTVTYPGTIITNSGVLLRNTGLTVYAFLQPGSDATGSVKFTDNSGSNFNRLQLGGVTASYPSIQRSGTSIITRLADDSAHCNLECAQLNTTGNIVANGASNILWNARSGMSSAVNGNIRISNNAGTDFGLLQFGGTTSSFPALKRSLTAVQVRLADDSAFSQLDTGNIKIQTAGDGICIKEGTNATMGIATLTAGSTNVSTSKVTASSRIFLTTQVPGGTVGYAYVSSRGVGTGFTITSTSGSDTSQVAWLIIEPA
jgi:hypothetical protein